MFSPKLRLDKDAWRRVEQDNRTLAAKLKAVAREPPSNYHAPRGYSSLKDGQERFAAQGGRPKSEMTETSHYVPPTPWPPKAVHHEVEHRAKVGLGGGLGGCCGMCWVVSRWQGLGGGLCGLVSMSQVGTRPLYTTVPMICLLYCAPCTALGPIAYAVRL